MLKSQRRSQKILERGGKQRVTSENKAMSENLLRKTSRRTRAQARVTFRTGRSDKGEKRSRPSPVELHTSKVVDGNTIYEGARMGKADIDASQQKKPN